MSGTTPVLHLGAPPSWVAKARVPLVISADTLFTWMRRSGVTVP
ncbi:hypothetical protein [Peterkaempfera sp. SMS 1(5)a]